MTNNFNPQIFNFKSNLRNILIIAAVIVILIVGLAVYFVLTAEKKEVAEEVVPESEISQEMEAGEEGEIEEGQTLEQVNPEAITMPVRPPGTPMPPVVFNTQGTITSVQKDGLIVQGNGSNFEDQKPRALNIKFTGQTVITEQQGAVRYLGLEGLKYLSPGDNILIESQENIRGKAEFQASYINKI